MDVDHAPSALDLSHAWRRWWWVIGAFAVIGALTALLVTQLPSDKYSASLTLVVQLPESANDTEALVRTVEALATSTVVLSDLSRAPGVNLSPVDVEDRIDVQRPTGSAVIDVVVTDSSRARAEVIARELVTTLRDRMREMGGRRTPAAAVPLGVRSFGGPPHVDAVDRPRARNGVLGAAVGLVIGLLVATALVTAETRRDGWRR
jgi:capsular polysaccharide biosynthesis protein